MKQNEPTYAPTLIVATLLGTAALALAFVAQRTADLGQLPAALGQVWATFPACNFNSADFTGHLLGAGYGALIVCCWLGAGYWLEKLPVLAVTEASHTALLWARRGALGAGAWSLVWLGLGTVSLYQPGVARGALALGLAAFAGSLRGVARPKFARQDWGAAGWCAFLLVCLVLLLSLVAALAPPTAKDTLLYHYSLPKHYLATGGQTAAPYNLASYIALGVEMQSVWGFLLGGATATREAAAGFVNWAFTPLLALMLYGWAREQGATRAWAWLAALFVGSVPTAYYVSANAYIDIALALYAALAAHAAGRWWTTAERGWLLHLALAAGCALCLKLTAVFLLMPLGLLFLWRARQAESGIPNPNSQTPDTKHQPKQILLAGCCTLALACLLASPWYIKTWQRTGSPFFPFYLNLWKGSAPGWDVERSQLFQEMNRQYGGAEKGAADFLITPYKISVTAQPELYQHFDGVLGIVFLCGLPLLAWAVYRRCWSPELNIAVFLSGAHYLFWLFSSQQLRYLLPALPGLAVALAIAAARASQQDGKRSSPVLQWSFLGASLLGVLTAAAWFCQLNPLAVVLGREPREAYLARHLDYMPYYQQINTTLPPAAKIWLINMRRDTYHLERPYFSDYLFEDYTLNRLVNEARDLADLHRRVREMGVTHLLVRHDVLFDPARSVIVDPRRSDAENNAKMQLLKDFLTREANVLRQDAKFLLAEMPR